MVPIRILHIVPNMQAGGLESFIMNIYRNIDRDKVQFDFLYHYEGKYFFDDEIKKMGGRIYNLTIRQDNNILKYKRELCNFFEEHKEYKVIHSHMPSLAFIHLKISKKFGISTRILHSHTSSFEKNLKGYAKSMLSKFSVKHSNYRFACSIAAGEYLFKSKKFEVVNNAIDSKKYVFDSDIRKKIREELNLEDKFIIGHVGRFEKAKNHIFLISIIKEILRIRNDVVLFLVGDGSLKKDIESKIKKENLERNVILYGVSDRVEKLLQAMDVFILPSLFEGLGIVLIEAQAAGLKCFASSYVVPKEAKVSDNIEYISLQEDPKIWAENILNYYNGYERKNIIENIYEHNYDIVKLSEKMEKFYVERYKG